MIYDEANLVIIPLFFTFFAFQKIKKIKKIILAINS